MNRKDVLVIIESNEQNKFKLSRLVKEGKAKRIAKGFFIRIPAENEREEIKKRLPEIISKLVGECRLAYRSGLVPLGSENEIILQGNSAADFTIGGSFSVRVIKSKKAIDPTSGTVIFENLYRPGTAEAILENLSSGKYADLYADKAAAARLLQQSVFERDGDPVRCSGLIAEIERAKEETGMKKEAEAASDIVNEAIVAYAMDYGRDVDYRRIVLFNTLKETLERDTVLTALSEKLMVHRRVGEQERKNEAFFESYFSNYIEGTRFHEDEAVDIVFNDAAYKRHEDGHDLISLYQLSLSHGMVPVSIVLSDPESVMKSIKEWHAFFLSHSPAKHPGEFKTRKNSAGDTDFVVPDKVERMLREAFLIGDSISDPLKQAIFAAIASVEVHPFIDGNGRITRLLLNDILTGHGRRRIIFPTVFRADYLRNLKAFSAQGSCSGIVKFFQKLIQANLEIDYRPDIKEVIAELKGKNAFSESETGKWGVAEAADGRENDIGSIFATAASVQEDETPMQKQ